MNEESFLEKTILFELGGKNQAIHEYDKMIWSLRIGFLTVFFAIWGILIDSLIKKGEIAQLDMIITLMSVLAAVIVVGAVSVDCHYVIRKYKVIRAMNEIYKTITGIVGDGKPNPEDFKDLIIISGTTKVATQKQPGLNLLRNTGFWREVVICIIIYLLPFTVLITGLVILK